MIQGYADQPSLFPGETLTLHVSTDAAQFRVDFYRQGQTLAFQHSLPIPVPPTVNIHRPGGGTGGTPWDIFNFDPFDPTPHQTFVHRDVPFIIWLEKNGYAVDYCTDLDIHQDASLYLLAAYRLLLSVGHDEYWSDAMRNNVQAFIQRGHNVAFFSKLPDTNHRSFTSSQATCTVVLMSHLCFVV